LLFRISVEVQRHQLTVNTLKKQRLFIVQS